MRKLLFLPLFLLLLVACSAATVTEEDTAAPDNQDTPATAVPAATQNDDSASTAGNPVEIGTTPEEAGMVREQDHTLGASDAAVTIIEYGDFQ